MSNPQPFSNDRLIWILVRFLGLCLCVYAMFQLVGAGVVIGSVVKGFSDAKVAVSPGVGMPLEGEGQASSFLSNFMGSIYGSLLVSFLFTTLVPLALGIYALRGGGFFYRLLSHLPTDYEEHSTQADGNATVAPVVAQTPTQQRQEISQNIRQERAQREVTVDYATQQKMQFAQFAQQFPQQASLPPKERYDAFHHWQQAQGQQ